MKASKKILCILILFAAAFPLFAQDLSFIKKGKHEKDTAIIVGKIKIIYDADRDFYAKTFGFDKKQMEYPDKYCVPYPVDENCHGDCKKLPMVYVNGDYFYNYCWVVKNKIKFNSNIFFALFENGTDLYCLLNPALLFLKFRFLCNVPKDEQYLYVGTIVYHLSGPYFDVTRIEVIDEFDQAVKDFEQVAGSDKKLCRAILETY